MLIAAFTGFLLEWTGSYVPVFILAGSAYLAALSSLHERGARATLESVVAEAG